MDTEILNEYEGLISQAVNRGVFASKDDALRTALDLLCKNYLCDTLSQAVAADSDWLSRFGSFVDRHRPSGMALDDSRENIYQDRW